MKKLTAIDLRENMTYGQKIYAQIGGNFRGYRFVGYMPDSENYLILSNGDDLRYLHISGKDDSFHGD